MKITTSFGRKRKSYSNIYIHHNTINREKSLSSYNRFKLLAPFNQSQAVEKFNTFNFQHIYSVSMYPIKRTTNEEKINTSLPSMSPDVVSSIITPSNHRRRKNSSRKNHMLATARARRNRLHLQLRRHVGQSPPTGSDQRFRSRFHRFRTFF